MPGINPQSLLEAIDRSSLVELVSDLIRIPSVNPKDAADCARFGITPGEGELAAWIGVRLRNKGLEVRLEEIAPGRSNLIARLPGRGNGPTLAFNGHIDTIGAYEMGERAFSPEVREGRLNGRGAADMKGGIGCFVALLEILAENKFSLPGDIVLTAVVGEEGPPSGTEYLVKHGFHANGAVVGEATGCQVYIGQRGGQFICLKTQGKTAHGSLPSAGINAITHMVTLLNSAQEMSLFKQAHPEFGAPTLTIGTIRGGVRTNVIPDACEATLDIRFPPGIMPTDVLKAWEDQMRSLGIRGTVEAEEEGHPAYLTSSDTCIVRAAQKATSLLGLADRFTLAPYWTDLAYLHRAGVPTIISGPGSILQAHSGDEYVAIDQLFKAAKLYAMIALFFCEREM
ncbi:MAG: M20 family metallopeptidase [Chloroflexi bacterium]|nr:M20 family metallopeptidase [Chloroflexota bacterium]